MYLLVVKTVQKVWTLGFKALAFMPDPKVTLKGYHNSKVPRDSGYSVEVTRLFIFCLWSVLYPSVLICLDWWIFLVNIYVSIHFGKSQSMPGMQNSHWIKVWCCGELPETAVIVLQRQRSREVESLFFYANVWSSGLWHWDPKLNALPVIQQPIYLRGVDLWHKVIPTQMLLAHKK